MSRPTSCPVVQPTIRPMIRMKGRSRQLCWLFMVPHLMPKFRMARYDAAEDAIDTRLSLATARLMKRN